MSLLHSITKNALGQLVARFKGGGDVPMSVMGRVVEKRMTGANIGSASATADANFITFSNLKPGSWYELTACINYSMQGSDTTFALKIQEGGVNIGKHAEIERSTTTDLRRDVAVLHHIFRASATVTSVALRHEGLGINAQILGSSRSYAILKEWPGLEHVVENI